MHTESRRVALRVEGFTTADLPAVATCWRVSPWQLSQVMPAWRKGRPLYRLMVPGSLRCTELMWQRRHSACTGRAGGAWVVVSTPGFMSRLPEAAYQAMGDSKRY